MRADLALVGFGNVARRFAQLLDERRTHLVEDHDLDSRVVGIATARHGAAFRVDGINVPLAIENVTRGRTLASVGGREPMASAADVIAALSQSDAPLRVLIETTTLAIADGQPAIAHID